MGVNQLWRNGGQLTRSFETSLVEDGLRKLWSASEREFKKMLTGLHDFHVCRRNSKAFIA